jgi:hypothetical protein
MLFTDNSTAGREKEILGHKMEIKMHLGITNLENNRFLYIRSKKKQNEIQSPKSSRQAVSCTIIKQHIGTVEQEYYISR